MVTENSNPQGAFELVWFVFVTSVERSNADSNERAYTRRVLLRRYDFVNGVTSTTDSYFLVYCT